MRNFLDLLTTNAVVGIFGAGLLVVLISGGIDISFTATASVAQYLALTFANKYGFGWAGVFVIVVLTGVVVGAFNGFIIYRFKVNSTIVSIGTLNLLFGLLMWISNGSYISNLPDWFLKGVDWFDVTNASGDVFYVNLQIVLLVLSFAMTWILLYHTNIGRQIFALGGNPEGAQRLAFNVWKLHLIVYVYMGIHGGTGVGGPSSACAVSNSRELGRQGTRRGRRSGAWRRQPAWRVGQCGRYDARVGAARRHAERAHRDGSLRPIGCSSSSGW